ncbi:Transcription factor [Penicillium occitanis (nom. inval.)]|nr:Transcription factor [Penicillium occitanis (nom. inval.)]PCG93632.1 hypothetical protein PENOC_086800 [Penicillium occitanis (nom. inval.)]
MSHLTILVISEAAYTVRTVTRGLQGMMYYCDICGLYTKSTLLRRKAPEDRCAYHGELVPSTSSTPPQSTPEQYDDVLQDTIHQTQLSNQISNSRFGVPLTPEQENNLTLENVEFSRHARQFERRNLLQPECNGFAAYANFTTQSQSDIEDSILCSLSHDLPTTMNLGSGGLDWLDFQLQEPTMQQESSVMPLIDPNLGNSQGYGNNPAGLEIHDETTLPIDSSGNFTTNVNGQSLPTSQQWPFDQNRERFPPRCQLPPLRDILHGSVASAYGGNADTLEELVQLLSAPYIPKPDSSSYGATRLSAFYLLKEAIDQFFADFHPILPILHVPTWNLFKCPTVLLASMACIGAMLRDDQESVEESKAFSEICTRMIFWLVGSFLQYLQSFKCAATDSPKACSDSNSYSDLSYLSASCLHQIYFLGSGNHQLYQDADRSRGSLVGGLRGMGLLTSRLSIEAEKADLQPSISTNIDDVQAEWIQWIDREREKRVTWASFEYDCSLATLTGRRGAVDLGELPYRFPCGEALWEAPSAQAWRTLSLHSCSSISVTAVLERVMAGRSIPNELSSWGKRLCSQIIGRLLWDMKQLEVPYLSKALRLPSLLSVQQQAKLALLEGFENLSRSIGNPVSSKELIDHNISRLIVHYCNLYSSDDVMELVVYIVRNIAAAQQDQTNIQLIQAAKHRLAAKFTSDPSRTRKLVWHAAQILAIADQYLVSAPCEILRVFMGSIFLMAFAKYNNNNDSYYSGHEKDDLPYVKLDDIENTAKGCQSPHISDWILHGGPAYITGIDAIYCESFARHVSNRTQGLLQRIQYWGLSRKFVRILQIFEATR